MKDRQDTHAVVDYAPDKSLLKETVDSDTFLEQNPSDDVFKGVAEIKLVDSKLGDLLVLKKMIDAMYASKTPPIGMIYSAILGAPEAQLKTISQPYNYIKGIIIAHSIKKAVEDPACPYEFAKIVYSMSNGKVIDVSSEEQDTRRVQTSVDQYEDLPYRMHYAVLPAGSKTASFIFKYYPADHGCVVSVICPADKMQASQAFFAWLDVYSDAHNFYKGKAIDPNYQFLKLERIGWDSLFLEPGMKDNVLININTIFDKEDILKANGVQASRGIIISGPPGTGKTMFIKCLSIEEQGRRTVIWATRQHLYGAHDIRRLYELASELGPAIVILEDADTYLADRDRGEMSGSNSMLGELMQCLDGLVPLNRVVTIATSNRPQVIENALRKRPGRFDVHFFFGPPTAIVRKQMLTKLYERNSIPEAEIDRIVKLTDGFTGAELKEVFKLSVIKAVYDNAIDSNNLAHPTQREIDYAISSVRSLKNDKPTVAAGIAVDVPEEQEKAEWSPPRNESRALGQRIQVRPMTKKLFARMGMID